MARIVGAVLICGLAAAGGSCKHTIIDKEPPRILSPLLMHRSPGETAALTAMRAPGDRCSITFTTPSGEESAAAGLEDKTVDDTGQVSWNWTIDPEMKPGRGTIVVTCDERSATAKVVIE